MAKKVLSPHLSIYAPQVSSLFSIFHRMAGASLFLGVVGTMVWPLFRVGFRVHPEISPYIQFVEFYGPTLGTMFLTILRGIFCYHIMNGFRHMVWDMGFGFQNDSVLRSARVAAGAAGALFVAGIAFWWTAPSFISPALLGFFF